MKTPEEVAKDCVWSYHNGNSVIARWPIDIEPLVRDAITAERNRAEKLVEALRNQNNCPYCPNVGWYTGTDTRGEPEQIQCEWCCTTVDSKFNVVNKALAAYEKGEGC